MVDVVFADVAQPDQARIVSLNCDHFLKHGGMSFKCLVIKAKHMTERDCFRTHRHLDKGELYRFYCSGGSCIRQRGQETTREHDQATRTVCLLFGNLYQTNGLLNFLGSPWNLTKEIIV
jgi:hypothetical protein